MGSGSLLFKAYLVAQWIVLSSVIILFNKWLLSTAHFHFPLTLVFMHMVFIGLCAHAWKLLGWSEVPALSWHDLAVKFGPVTVCFAASLGLGNAAYLYITVAFVQMLKALTPVAVMLVAFAFGLERPNRTLAVVIVAISIGVCIACSGQIEMSVLGVALQLGAVAAEALRLG